MIKELQKIKEEHLLKLRPLEMKIDEIRKKANEDNVKSIYNLCNRQLKQTSKKIEREDKNFKRTVYNVLEYKQRVEQEKFKNKLAAVIYSLETHFDYKHSMEKDVRELKRLGSKNILIKNIANSIDKSILQSMEEPHEIYKTFLSTKDKATLSIFINQNQVLLKYILNLCLYYICKHYKFHVKLKEYTGQGNSLLVDNMRKLSYLEEYIKQQKYRHALEIIESLNVSYILIYIGIG